MIAIDVLTTSYKNHWEYTVTMEIKILTRHLAIYVLMLHNTVQYSTVQYSTVELANEKKLM